MNRIFVSLLLASIAAGSPSCSKNDTQDNPGPAPVNTQSIDIDSGKDGQYTGQANSSELQLTVESQTDWQLTVTDTRAAIDWVTPSSTSGKAGKNVVTFTITENNTPNERRAFLRFTNDASSVTFAYNQQHYDPAGLKLSVKEIEVGPEAVRQTFTLESDFAWSIASDDESVCTVTPVRGKAGTHTISVAITENTSTEKKRTTTLTARSGYEQATVIVTQDRKKPVLNIDRGIKTLDDLCRFRDAVNAGESLAEWKYNGEINLLADIDLSYFDDWVPIGTKKMPFEDVFNGNGFTIDNVTFYSFGSSALFGCCSGGTIKNLHVDHVQGGSAGICDRLESSKNSVGRITNCTADGYVLGGICYNVSFYDDEPQPAVISDCTNYAICERPIANRSTSGHRMPEIINCANEGVHCYNQKFPDHYIDYTENGYIIPESLYKSLNSHVSSLDEFIAYMKTSLENLKIGYIEGPYNDRRKGLADFNDKFIDLAVQSQSIRELTVFNYYSSDFPSQELVHLLEMIDRFPDLTVLNCSFSNGYNYAYGFGLKNVKGQLVSLNIKEDMDVDPRIDCETVFPALKNLIYDGPSEGYKKYLTSTLEYVQVNGKELEKPWH